MIEYAGLGVAMGMLIDSIKEIANFSNNKRRRYGVAVAVKNSLNRRTSHVTWDDSLSKPYASIASGKKTIELRLYDEKRQSIQIGDQIPLPILKMLLSLHSVSGSSCMFLKTLQNCMKSSHY